MLSDQAAGHITEARMGEYKKLLAYIQQWQKTHIKRTPPLIVFLKWLLGN